MYQTDFTGIIKDDRCLAFSIMDMVEEGMENLYCDLTEEEIATSGTNDIDTIELLESSSGGATTGGTATSSVE